MHWIDTVASYLPSLIVNHLINRTTNEELPSRQEYDTVCLFADVSGFTALSEAMMTSQEGVEGLAKHLNSYFGQMVRIIASEGGDVFKEGTTPMERRVRRAAQCAFAIQDALHNCELAEEVRLSVKIGIGMGKVSVLHLGGVYKRMEYIAVGEPLLQAFTAEHHATPGDAHKLVERHFRPTEIFGDNYCRIVKKQIYTPMRKQNKVNMLQQSLDDPLLELKIKGYIPGAVLRNLRPDSPEDEHWSNEIRRVTVLFVNLGLKEQTLLAAAVYDEAMEEMHRVMVAVQESVYEYEGSINKFLMDDKGSTLVAVYGLPPVGHADDPTRGVLAALRLCERLFDLAKVGSVGATTGEAFCGVVGSKTRKEYTVLGDSVNLAARLMQRATSEDGGVLCELATKRACGGLLQFKARGDFRIKGKVAAAKVFQPYPEDYPKPQPPQYLGANVYGLIHNQQRQNYTMHKLLTSLQPYFARPSTREAKDNISMQTSAMSSPIGERGRGSFLGGRGSGYDTGRGSLTGSGRDEDGLEPNTLLGIGDDCNMGMDSDTENTNDPMEDFDEAPDDLELHGPSYPADALHTPFQTEAIPIGMPSMESDDNGHPLAMGDDFDGATALRPCGVEKSAAMTPVSPEDSRDSGNAATSVGPVSAPFDEAQRSMSSTPPSLSNIDKSSRTHDLSRLPKDGTGVATTIASPVGNHPPPKQRGSAGSVGSGEGESEGSAPSVVFQGQAKQRSDRLKTIFSDRGSSNTAGSFQGIRRSSHENSSCGEDHAPRDGDGDGDGDSPLPPRGMYGRRQVDSVMKKIFRECTGEVQEDYSGGDAGEATPPSPGSESSGAACVGTGAGTGPGAWAANPSACPTGDPSAPMAPAAVPLAESSLVRGRGILRNVSGGSRVKGEVHRSSVLFGVGHGGGEALTEREESNDAGGGQADFGMRVPGVSDAAVKEHPIFSKLERAVGVADGGNLDSLKRERSRRMYAGTAQDEDGDDFKKEEEEEVVKATAIVGQRRRSSRQRLSIAQNGMVHLPAPKTDLGSSGVCSLPRHSRYSSPKSGIGSLIGGSQPMNLHTAFQGAPGRRVNTVPPSIGGGQSLLLPPAVPPSLAPSGTGSSDKVRASSGQPGSTRSGAGTHYSRRLDDNTSSASSNGGGAVARVRKSLQAMQRGILKDGCESWVLHVFVPWAWQWSSLPDHCHRLPPVIGSDVATFRGLLDRCYQYACADHEVMRWSHPTPVREDLVLNILGTRVMLPTYPDYDMDRLQDFVLEAYGTRGFRGSMGKRHNLSAESWTAGGGGAMELCLIPKKEILNFQSRWLNSRISLLQYKIALVQDQVGSVVLLEGLPGAGKTELLSVFTARTLMRTALTHFTAASPYNTKQSFGSWSMVLQQYLDRVYKQEIQAGREDPAVQDSTGNINATVNSNREGNSGGGAARSSVSGGFEAAASGILGRRQQLAGRDRMLLRELQGTDMEPFAFLVNDVLGTAIPSRTRLPSWDADSDDSSSLAYGDMANESEDSDSEESSRVGHHERMRLKILLQLVKNMARGKPRVVIIDDAQFMDKDSWTLVLAIATGGPLGRPLPIMLILSLRPLVHYRALFSSIPPDYKALTELPHVQFLKIEGAPEEEVEDLVSEKLGTNVIDIGDSLFGLVEELCTGNPLMISELVSYLKMMEPRQLRYSEIRSEEGEADPGASQNSIDVAVHVDLMDTFRVSDCLLPEKLNALLTSQTDRLNSCQLMALKVASLIGKEFSTWFLYRVYPINGHKARLLRELASLEKQGFLVEVQGERARYVIESEGCGRPMLTLGQKAASSSDLSSGDHSRSAKNVVYQFTHGFMMGMLKRKMLYSQKDFLQARIQKLKDNLETQRRHQDLKNQTIDMGQKYKSGMLLVMKHKVTKGQAAANARKTTRRRKDSIASRAISRVKQPVQQKWGEAVDWKRRKCLLMGESLYLYKDQRDKEPSEVVFLHDATAEPELGEGLKESGFRVETSLWKKGDEVLGSTGGTRRTFTFIAEDKEEKELWLHQIRYCIELVEVHTSKSGCGAIDRLTRMNSVRFGALDARPNKPMEDMDSTLVVKVEKADDLILEEIFGTTYPYCVVDLDDQGRRTNSVQSASVAPLWEQELTFGVSIQQWILSNLRLQIWNHDLFLTDDFLGQLTIPLKEVPVQEWDDEGDTPTTELKWHMLESRCRSKHTSGKLLLGVQLFMSKETTARAAGVGGVDKLKAFAERRMEISARAARVGLLLQRKQSLTGAVHHHHHHPNKLHPGVIPVGAPGFNRGGSGGANQAYSSIRASVRSMQMELEASGRASLRHSRVSSRGISVDSTETFPGRREVTSFTVRQDSSNGSAGRVSSMENYEDEACSGSGGVGEALAGGGAPRLSQKHRRRSAGSKTRRATSDGASHGLAAATALEVHHTDPLTRQLQLCLLAVETKAEVTKPEEGAGIGGSVNRDWVRDKLREMMVMVDRGNMDLDELATHIYYCKDRKQNTYGPFPAKQLVEAHNAGYINDRKVLVKDARMRGEFRPMGARALMHAPPIDEEFKMQTIWPQVDAHHPLAEKILSLSLGGNSSNDPSRDFRHWGFDIFVLETHELGMLAATILADMGLPRVFGISMKAFAHFMSAVGFFMGRNPRVSYHNLYHAVDVMHATYFALDGMGASGMLNETEELALILSALCHDLDHPGLTNSFQIATESPMANMYNDHSPLEHHHLAITFQILRRQGCDILGHLDKPIRDRIRHVMIKSILSTDITEHANHLRKIDYLSEEFPALGDRIGAWASGEIGRGSHRTGPYPASPPLHSETSSSTVGSAAAPVLLPTGGAAGGSGTSSAAVAATPCRPTRQGRGVMTNSRGVQVPGADANALGFDDEKRLTVASALLHAADVSSSGRPWGTCRTWVDHLLEEFKFQASEERQRGLRVTVLEGLPSSSQPGFINAFLIPFFTALLPIAPGLGDEYLPNLCGNRDRWEAMAFQEEQRALSDERLSVGWRSHDRTGTEGSTLDPESGRSNSAIFGSDRRYSGGTIGIASMLGSLGVVSSGRRESDFLRRTSSNISSSISMPPPATPPHGWGWAVGNGSAPGVTRRSVSANGAVSTGVGTGGGIASFGREHFQGDEDLEETTDGIASGSINGVAEEKQAGMEGGR